MLDKYEEKLKENITNYEIKTTSDDILNSYKTNNKELNKSKNKKKLFITLSSLFSSGILVGACLLTVFLLKPFQNNTNTDSNPNNTSYQSLPSYDYLNILNSKDKNLVGFELSSLLNNTSGSTINGLNKNILLKNKISNSITIDQNYFIKVVNNFDLAADSIKTLYDSNNNYSLLASNVSFTYNNEVFKIRTDIYNNNEVIYSLYINQSSYEVKNNEETWMFEGYINYNEKYYPITLSKEVENTELEIETRIIFDNYIAIVSKEIDNDESEYEFEYFDLNNNSIYNFEIESNLIKDTTIEVSVEDFKSNLEYEYLITIVNNDKYSILLDDEENDNTFAFILEFLTNKVYSKEGFESIYK